MVSVQQFATSDGRLFVAHRRRLSNDRDVNFQLKLFALGLTATLAGAPFQAAAAPTTTKGSSPTAIAAAAVTRTGPVTDAANLLTPAQRAALAAKLAGLERTTRHEMAIVTVRSLGGKDVAVFTRDLGRSWGVGRKANDGVVLLVAPVEQMVWIAVGKGLEGKLTKEACQTIMDETMMPRFRSGDLPGGIDAGTDALIARLH